MLAIHGFGLPNRSPSRSLKLVRVLIVATDRWGDEVFSGRIPASGSIEISLIQFRMKPGGKIELIPYDVTVGGLTRRIIADRPRAYQVTGGAWKELPVEPPNTPPFSSRPGRQSRVPKWPFKWRKVRKKTISAWERFGNLEDGVGKAN